MVSRAYGDSGSFQTYSRIPLHLRSNALNRNKTNKQTEVRSSKTTADSGKAKADNNVKQTRVGHKINTPTRFVQLVHAVVAANDIHAGPAASIAITNF